jgi:hypothetical protein
MLIMVTAVYISSKDIKYIGTNNIIILIGLHYIDVTKV